MPNYIDRYCWLILEGPKLGSQWIKTIAEVNQIKEIEEGDMIPTIVVPGFTASNASTYFMRRILNSKGYNTHIWVEPRNLGFNPTAIANTLSQVKHLSDTAKSKINLVGQSLGGCYIRAVANEIPDYINSVVTFGSPINGIDLVSDISLRKYNSIVGVVDAAILHHSEYYDKFYPNPPCPTSSLYSKDDGIVSWPLSIIEESDLSENIEIQGSHFGMGFDLNTIKIIANRISKCKDKWSKFKTI